MNYFVKKTIGTQIISPKYSQSITNLLYSLKLSYTIRSKVGKKKSEGFEPRQILQIWKITKQELQEVLKFPIEIFWNLEASLKSELLYL